MSKFHTYLVVASLAGTFLLGASQFIESGLTIQKDANELINGNIYQAQEALLSSNDIIEKCIKGKVRIGCRKALEIANKEGENLSHLRMGCLGQFGGDENVFCGHLQNLNLDSASLNETDFSGLDMTGASFKNASLRGAVFKNTNLSRVDFSDADLSEATFEMSSVENAIFSGARIHNTSFEGSVLRSTNFTNANIYNSTFNDADLSCSDFSKSVIDHTDFLNAHFISILGSSLNNLRDNLTHISPDNIDFVFGHNDESCSGAKMIRAKIAVTREGGGVNFGNADLSYVDFSYASLGGATFHGANLTGANFYKTIFGFDFVGITYQPDKPERAKAYRFRIPTNFTGANLNNVKNYTKDDVGNSCSYGGHVLPENVVSIQSCEGFLENAMTIPLQKLIDDFDPN